MDQFEGIRDLIMVAPTSNNKLKTKVQDLSRQKRKEDFHAQTKDEDAAAQILMMMKTSKISEEAYNNL